MNDKEQHIIKTACQLFLRYGLKSVSVDEIASQCGISKKTLYELIGSKKNLVEQVINYRIDSNSKRALHFYDNDEVSAIENMLVMYQQGYDFFQKYNTSMQYDLRKFDNVLFEKLSTENVKIFGDALIKNYLKGQKQDLYRKDFNVNLTAHIHLITIKALMDKIYAAQTEEYSFLELYKEYFLLNMHAILSEKGKKVFDISFKKLENNSI